MRTHKVHCSRCYCEEVAKLEEGTSAAPNRAGYQSSEEITETIARGVLKEGMPTAIADDSIVGRWAGDEDYLVGDYDDSGLYDRSRGPTYRNITAQVVEAWNGFIGVKSKQLEYEECCVCEGASS